MKIYDKNNNLLALIVNENSRIEKDFKTENHFEFQVASFNLEKNAKIDRHYHPQNKRFINSTSEALVLVSGKILVTIYDKDEEIVHSSSISEGEMVVFFAGGHELSVEKDSYFFEIKQGPYNEKTDKVRF